MNLAINPEIESEPAILTDGRLGLFLGIFNPHFHSNQANTVFPFAFRAEKRKSDKYRVGIDFGS